MGVCSTRFVPGQSSRGVVRRAGLARAPIPTADPSAVEQLEARTLMSFSWTPQEVYLSELVNRARANPQAEAARLGIDLSIGLTSAEAARLVAQEPLALNRFLTQAARAHSLDMATRNFFDHTNPDGLSPTQRAQAAGYGGTAGENIAAGYADVDAAHLAWMQSVGHRKNVLSLHSTFDSSFHYDEFGPGLALGAGGTYNNYYTQNFGYQGPNPAFYLLGVVFNDADNNDFYGIGEGASGIRIDVALQSAPSTVVGTYTTDAAGNYQIALGAGSYRVTFTRLSDNAKVVKNATIAGQNVRVAAETGELVLPSAPDDFADQGEWNIAGVLQLDPTLGHGVKVGYLESIGDTDLFKFVATKSGATTITLTHPAGQFAMQLTAYNGQRATITNGIPGGEFGNGSMVRFDVVAGQTYFLLARAVNSASLGTYLILVEGPDDNAPPASSDDFADIGELSTAGSIQLEQSSGHGSKVGYIESIGDTDLFRMDIPRSGTMTITLSHPEGGFGTQLRLFDASGALIMIGTPGGAAGLGSVVTLTVTAGQRFYVSAEASDGQSLGVYLFSIQGPGAEPPPPPTAVINEGVLPARESLVSSMWRDGRLTLVYMNGWNQPVIATRNDDGSWTWSDVRGGSEPVVDGEIVTWTDRRDQRNYAAMRSIDGLLLFREDVDGTWSYRNLNDELPLGSYISSDLSMLVDRMGRASIVGVSDGGEVITYMQLLKKNAEGGYIWAYRNITATDIEARRLEVPEVYSELVTWVTPNWSCNIAFLNQDGAIQLLYKPVNKTRWFLQNLGAVAPIKTPLVGELTVFQTPANRGVHIAGTAENGDVWVTSFRDKAGWSSRNLTARLKGPALEIRSLTSYVDRNGVGYIAGIRSDGDISMYRYAPKKNAWGKVAIVLQTPNWRNMMGRLDATVNAGTGEINIVGTLDSARLVRWSWAPGRGWQYEDVTQLLAEAVVRGEGG